MAEIEVNKRKKEIGKRVLKIGDEEGSKKRGWDAGCCGVIRCFECKRLVYCARLNIETCIACMKDCCDYCFENIHGTEKSRLKRLTMHEKLTAEQVGRDIDEIRTQGILQKIRF